MTTEAKKEGTHILLAGQLGRRLPDGVSEQTFRRGDLLVPSAGELAAFGDLLLPASEWEAYVAAAVATKEAEARARLRRARPKTEEPPGPERDPAAQEREKIIAESEGHRVNLRSPLRVH